MTEHFPQIFLSAMLLALGGCSGDSGARGDARTNPGLSGIRYLSAGDSQAGGFAQAVAARDFRFPEDHAAHPDFRTEWWYFTGNVFDPERNHYGFELTLFRVALVHGATDIWMGNLAVTDTGRKRFQATERLSRGAPGLAGAQMTEDGTLQLRIEDWSIALSGDSGQLKAEGAGFGIDLALDGLDRIVLQGDGGLDRKGPESGNASYYYSAPRLAVTGTVHSAGHGDVPVTGTAWLDREWSTSALSPGVAGWDWFALQLDDGTDLMFYRLRNDDGSTNPFSSGTLVTATGDRRALATSDVELRASRHWTSPATGIRYPVAWQLEIPAADLTLAIEPRMAGQELDLTVRYWEGAVTVSGTHGPDQASGVGYLELAGY